MMRGSREMVRRLDVLLVNEDRSVCEPLAAQLGQRHEVRVAVGLRAAINELVQRAPDAIVCDLDLTPYSGDALLAMVARELPQVRRVLYTGPLDPGDSFADVAHVTLPRQASLGELLAAIAGDD